MIDHGVPPAEPVTPTTSSSGRDVPDRDERSCTVPVSVPLAPGEPSALLPPPPPPQAASEADTTATPVAQMFFVLMSAA